MLNSFIKNVINRVIFTINKFFPASIYRTRYLNRFFLKTERVSIIDVGSYGGYLDYWKRNDINFKLSFDPIEDRTSSKKEIILKVHYGIIINK